MVLATTLSFDQVGRDDQSRIVSVLGPDIDQSGG
jgi:hypothetical protein